MELITDSQITHSNRHTLNQTKRSVRIYIAKETEELLTVLQVNLLQRDLQSMFQHGLFSIQ